MTIGAYTAAPAGDPGLVVYSLRRDRDPRGGHFPSLWVPDFLLCACAGDYLAIVTLGFGEVTRLVLNNWDSLTNGPKGLPRVGDNPSRFNFACSALYFSSNLCITTSLDRRLRAGRGVDLPPDLGSYRSVGRAWVAIREDEIAAELMGVEVTQQKIVAFGVSAIFAAAWPGRFSCALGKFCDAWSSLPFGSPACWSARSCSAGWDRWWA